MMMKCDEIFGLIASYVDGELADVQGIKALEAHLRECPNCREEFQTQREVKSLLKEASIYGIRAVPSTSLKTRVLAEIRGNRQIVRLKLRPAYAISFASLIVIIFIASFGFYLGFGLKKPLPSGIYKALPPISPEAESVFTAEGETLLPASETTERESFIEFVKNRHNIAKELLILEADWAKDLEKLGSFVELSDKSLDESIFKELPTPESDKEPKNSEEGDARDEKN